MHHPEHELEALNHLLFKFQTSDEGMSLSEFDGFCAGLIISPDMIVPSEWLPFVFGEGSSSQFKNDEDLQDALNLVMDHYNRVAQTLSSDTDDYETVFEIDRFNGETLWEPWLDGFMRAKSIKPDPWGGIFQSGDQDLIEGMVTLQLMHDFYIGEVDLPNSEIDKLDEQALDLIPSIVLRLNHWVKSGCPKVAPFAHQTPANLPGAPFGQKIGRNDPCPCGSGKKFKKCCGG